MPKLKLKESAIQKQIMNYLKLKGMVWKLHTTGVPDGKGGFRVNFSKGLPDILFIHPCNGLTFFEVKRLGGKLTPDQLKFQEACINANIMHFVVHSLDCVMGIVK